MSCGEGLKTRSRGCNSPAPSQGGRPCQGEERDSQPCTVQACIQPVELPPECGDKKIRGAIRITNGQPAKKNAWPWQVAIGKLSSVGGRTSGYRVLQCSGYNNTEGNIDYLCGATLITKR